MESHHDRSQQYYRHGVYGGHSQAAHVPATYQQSLMAAARFRAPRLPLHTAPGSTSQALAHNSFLGSEQFATNAVHDGYQFPVTSSMDGTPHAGYGTHHQQPVLPSYGSAGYVYGYQDTSQDPTTQPYQSNNMRSMSMSSSHYDMSQTPQLYSTQTAQESQPSTTIGSDAYEPMAIDHHGFQAPATTLEMDDGYAEYAPYEQARQQFAVQRSQSDLLDSFEHYRTQTKQIFTCVKERQIKPTASLLLQISRYLIGNVESLGLDRDDRSQHEERLKLWDTFNQCWLTALQMQFKITLLMARTGQQLPLGQSVLDADTLEALGQELVRLCDGIEKVGLVDYQMGVAEEQIVELLIKCLDTLGPQSPSTPRASGSSAGRG